MYNISKDGVLTFNKVEKIKDKQFKDNKEIKEIIFPNTLKEIGEEAFSCCTSLEKVFFPSNLTKIDKSAFEGCSSLKSIHLKSKIRTVDYKFLQIQIRNSKTFFSKRSRYNGSLQVFWKFEGNLGNYLPEYSPHKYKSKILKWQIIQKRICQPHYQHCKYDNKFSCIVVLYFIIYQNKP